MKSEELENWKVAHDKGIVRYVIVRGILSYGLPMFIALTFIAHRDDLSPSLIAVSATLCFIGGAMFGVAIWYTQERKYREQKDQE